MFRHIFIYNLKSIMRSRDTVFWSLLYPIVLATLFHFAFSNLASMDEFHVIPIAVVESDRFESGSNLYEAMSELSDIDGVIGEDDLFRVTVATKAQADELLKNGEISAYLSDDDELKMVVGESGFDQTITKVFLDDYLQISSTVRSIVGSNPDALEQGLLTDIALRTRYLTEVPISSVTNPDTTVIYFYILLAMTCLMGSVVAVQEII